jgi:hypothetical protein
VSQKTRRVTPDRDGKRARFESRTERKSSGKPAALLIGIVALIAIVAGGVLFALSQKPAVISAAPASAPALSQSSAPGQPAAPSVKAATVGHDPYPVVEAVDGIVSFPLATFDDHKARYYTYVQNGKSIEFFILESKDGTVRAAFNACDVCFPAKKGYTQDGDEMVCNNCGRRFPADQINVVQGGCNPSPLNRSAEGDTLIIQSEDIAAGVKYF